jgi:hypothetical protein
MKKRRNLYPIFVVIVFFFFTLLHQTDKLLIGFNGDWSIPAP